MKKNGIIFVAIALCLFLMGCKKEPYYNLKSKTKEYIAFFGKGSWWTYQIEGTSDTVLWQAVRAERFDIHFDNYKSQHFTAFCETNSGNSYGYNSRSSSTSDFTGSIWGDITSDDDNVMGENKLPLEDTVIVSGLAYINVLHLYVTTGIIKEVWIAPNVGIIKMKDQKDNVFTLKSFKIEKL